MIRIAIAQTVGRRNDAMIFSITLHLVLLVTLYMMTQAEFISNSGRSLSTRLTFAAIIPEQKLSVETKQKVKDIPEIQKLSKQPLRSSKIPLNAPLQFNEPTTQGTLLASAPMIAANETITSKLPESERLSSEKLVSTSSSSNISELKKTPPIELPIEKIAREPQQVGRPDYAHNPLPDYPIALREQGISGTVWMRVWVDSNGLPQEIRFAKESGYRLFDEAAIRAVRQWKFVPATRNDVSFASWVEFPIRFKLNS